MFKLSSIEKRFSKAKDLYVSINPSLHYAAKSEKIIKAVTIISKVASSIELFSNGYSPTYVATNLLSSHICDKIFYNPVSSVIEKGIISGSSNQDISNISHLNNGYNTFSAPGQYKLVIVFHDADKAGPHLDIHFDNGVSFIRRVKPHIYNNLSYNAKGELTQSSKDLLIDFLNDEIKNHSRIPQNIDHNWKEAHYLWLKRNSSGIKDGDYGAGNTRQVVLETKAEIIKINDSSATLYIGEIGGNNLHYIHNLYPSDGKKAPIAIWGETIKKAPKLQDKLHLKLVSDKKKFLERMQDGYITLKYDGASTIIVTSPDGSVAFSPRISKQTGERINYLAKLPEVGQIKTDEKWIVRGELLFKRGKSYLKAHEIGGILNAHKLRPKDITPEIRVYRVEKHNNSKLQNITFEQNQELLSKFIQLNPDLFKLPEEVTPQFVSKAKNIEGFVGIPKGESLDNGYKFKLHGDENDWKVSKVELSTGPTGRTAGVVWFKSLESGKEFKLGPGQLGTEEFVKSIRSKPEDYIGKTYKVKSRHGHEGRAAKLVMEHMDK